MLPSASVTRLLRTESTVPSSTKSVGSVESMVKAVKTFHTRKMAQQHLNPQERTEPDKGLVADPSGNKWTPEFKKAWAREYYAANKERYKKNNRIQQLKKYGLTPEDYSNMLESQGGVCAICGADNPRDGRENLHVDHCHSTGKVRGLLCGPCNKAIGLLQDDPTIIRNAANYLS